MSKAWRAKHREALIAARAEVRQRFGIPEPTRNHRQIAIKANRLSPGIRERLYIRQRGLCACCRRPLGSKYHLDHIMPLALGGSNTDDNVQLLRASCNMSKGASHPDAFRGRQKRRAEYRRGKALGLTHGA